jgi:hypothetical protein
MDMTEFGTVVIINSLNISIKTRKGTISSPFFLFSSLIKRRGK